MSSKRALLADDHHGNRYILEQMLSSVGMQVHSLDGGAQVVLTLMDACSQGN